jgi:polycystin 2
MFSHLFEGCYDFFSSSSEDTASFGLKIGSAWNYNTSEELDGFPFWTKFQVYPGGGFVQELGIAHEKNRLKLKELHENGWLNRGTRVVFIEFAFYNPNIQVIASTKLIVEALPTGVLQTSTNIRPMKLVKFTSASDYLLMIAEVLVMLQIVFFSYYGVVQLRKSGWKHFKFSFWMLVDLIILVLGYTFSVLLIFWKSSMQQKRDEFSENVRKFVNFDAVSFWHLVLVDFLGLFTFFVWIRILKFFNFNKTMLQFGRTLQKCAKDVAGFGLMFIIVFVAYAQLGLVLFGSELHDFRTFFNSVFTLLRTILGDFDYLAIEETNRVLGPIYFISYVFIVFFVLLNMFLAIINETYTDVKSVDRSEVFPLGSFIKSLISRFVSGRRWMRRKKKSEIDVEVNTDEKAVEGNSDDENEDKDEVKNENNRMKVVQKNEAGDQPKSEKSECMNCKINEEKIER